MSNIDPTADLDAFIADVQTRLSDLEEAVDAIVGPLDPPDVADLKAEVEDLKTAMAALNALVRQDVQGGLVDLNDRVGHVEASTAEAVSLVHDLEGGISNLSTTMGDVASDALTAKNMSDQALATANAASDVATSASTAAVNAAAVANTARGDAASAANAAAAADVKATSAQGSAAAAQTSANAAKAAADKNTTDIAALDARLKKLENPTPPVTGIDPWRNPFSASSLWNRKVGTLGVKRNDNWGTRHWPSRNAVPYTIQPDSGGTTWTITCPQFTVTGRFAAVNLGGDSDSAMCVVIDNDVYSFWQATIDGSNHITAKLGIKTVLDSTGFGPGPGQKAGTRAAGWSLLAGNITGPDLANRLIAHALQMAIPRSSLSPESPGYVAPATTADSGWQTTYGGSIRMGSRWAIPKTTPCPSSNVDCQTVWRCFQDYGGYVGDATSTGLAIIMERTSTNDAQANAIGGIMQAVADNLVPVLTVA